MRFMTIPIFVGGEKSHCASNELVFANTFLLSRTHIALDSDELTKNFNGSTSEFADKASEREREERKAKTNIYNKIPFLLLYTHALKSSCWSRDFSFPSRFRLTELDIHK